MLSLLKIHLITEELRDNHNQPYFVKSSACEFDKIRNITAAIYAVWLRLQHQPSLIMIQCQIINQKNRKKQKLKD